MAHMYLLTLLTCYPKGKYNVKENLGYSKEEGLGVPENRSSLGMGNVALIRCVMLVLYCLQQALSIVI